MEHLHARNLQSSVDRSIAGVRAEHHDHDRAWRYSEHNKEGLDARLR